MVFSLSGRRALIVGGAGGLGQAMSMSMCAQGADVVIADLRGGGDFDAELAGRFPERVTGSVEMDVLDEASVIAGVTAATERLGGAPDITVTAAGIGELQLIEDMTYEQWRRMVGIHLDGTFLPIRHTVGPMLESGFGRIICFSSIASLQGVDRQAHYAAGKGGVDGLVRSFSLEVADRGVTVNAIAPGYFESPLNSLASPERLQRLRSNVPSGEFGDPAQIGALAVFLASDEASYLTGQIISPNGGFRYCNLINS
jgi:3-oxoacyl-[acyl-carrier protein] reductase